MAGVSALFTDEFFADVKTKLAPGGVVCQWFHYYNMSLEHIRLLARTFARHFPEACLFVLRGDQPTGDIVLIGCNGPLRMARLPDDPTLPAAVRAALTEVKNADPQQLLGGLVAAPATFVPVRGRGSAQHRRPSVLEFERPPTASDPTTTSETVNADDRVRAPRPSSRSARRGDGARRRAPRRRFRAGARTSAGRETQRGATVLTKLGGEGEPIGRWVLGREFDSGAERTGSPSPATLRSPTKCATSRPRSPDRASSPVRRSRSRGGAFAVVAESEGVRTVVVEWIYPMQSASCWCCGAHASTVRPRIAGPPSSSSSSPARTRDGRGDHSGRARIRAGRRLDGLFVAVGERDQFLIHLLDWKSGAVCAR
jgi:hypothetical protein